MHISLRRNHTNALSVQYALTRASDQARLLPRLIWTDARSSDCLSVHSVQFGLFGAQ